MRGEECAALLAARTLEEQGLVGFAGCVCHVSVDISERARCSLSAAATPSSELSGTRTVFTDHWPPPYAYFATFVEKPRGSGCGFPARKPQFLCHSAAPSVSVFNRCRQIASSWM